MTLLEEHLRCLGLTSSSSTVELKAAYRREISKWHPDRFHDDPELNATATVRAKKINAAYECLSELHENGRLPGPNPRTSKARSNAKRYYSTQHTYNQASFTPGFSDPLAFEVFVKSSHIVSTGVTLQPAATQNLRFW